MVDILGELIKVGNEIKNGIVKTSNTVANVVVSTGHTAGNGIIRANIGGTLSGIGTKIYIGIISVVENIENGGKELLNSTESVFVDKEREKGITTGIIENQQEDLNGMYLMGGLLAITAVVIMSS